MLWSLLTCPAIHAAACPPVVVAALAGTLARAGIRCGLPGEAVRAEVVVSWMALTTAAPAITMLRTTSSVSPGRRIRGTRRVVHRWMVVASTRPHEGTGDGVVGVADRAATLVRLQPATCIGNPVPCRAPSYLR